MRKGRGTSGREKVEVREREGDTTREKERGEREKVTNLHWDWILTLKV